MYRHYDDEGMNQFERKLYINEPHSYKSMKNRISETIKVEFNKMHEAQKEALEMYWKEYKLKI